MLSELELASGLRAAAAWERSWYTPKCRGILATAGPAPGYVTGPFVPNEVDPRDPKADSWCALGRARYETGLDDLGLMLALGRQDHYAIWTAHDHGNYRAAADALDRAAARIEESIPTREPAPEKALV